MTASIHRVSRATRRVGAALAAGGLALALASPAAAAAPDCVTSSSRVPLASRMPTAGAAPAYRLAMARAAPSRPAAGTRPSGNRIRKASVHRVKAGPSRARTTATARRRAKPATQVGASLSVARVPAAAPTSPQVAARRVGYARYALIETTVCETGAPPLRLLSLAGPPNADEAGAPAIAVFPVGPGGDDGGLTFFPPSPPEDGEPPFIDVGGPNPPTTPPVPPPDAPNPPVQPPLPPTAAVPEPGNWVLMIAGFGLAGAALRRRPGARAELGTYRRAPRSSPPTSLKPAGAPPDES